MPFTTVYFTSNRSKGVDINIESYVDAAFANRVDNIYSISGYALMIAGGPISRQSRPQQTVALSTMEAEYMAAATAKQ